MQRNNYFDFLRGIAILMVVAIHTFPSSDFDCVAGVINIGIRQALNCAVPLFFAISGYFLSTKQFEKRSDVWKFWKHQIPKVYIPVLIWSLPYLIGNLYKGENPVTQIVEYFFCGQSIYYFIAVIIQFYFLLPLLLKIKRMQVLLYGSICISMVSITGLVYHVWMSGISWPLIVSAGHAGLWLVFFVLGMILRRSEKQYSCWWPLGLVLVSFVLQVVEAYHLYGFYDGGLGIKPSSFLFSIGIILLVFCPVLEKSYSERFFILVLIRKIGYISFGIYLIHYFFIILLSYSYMGGAPWGARWIITTIGSVLVIFVADRLLPERVKHYIGF